MVERDLAKVEVAGSTPVSRSSGVSLPTFPCQQPRFRFHLAHQARYPSGKGEVCKTFMRRFDPDPRLQILNQSEAPAGDSAARCSENYCQPLYLVRNPGGIEPSYNLSA